MRRKVYGSLSVLPIALSLAACGGGGDNSSAKNDTGDVSPPSTTEVSRSQATQLVSDEVAAVAQFSGAQSGDITSAEGVIDAFNVASLSDVGLLAVTETTFFCSSPDPQNVDTGNGSVTITKDDQDPVGRSTGDSVTTTFNQCVQFGSTLNGSTSNEINSLTGDPFVTAPWVVETTHTTDLTRTGATRSSANTSTSTSKAESTDGVVISHSASGEGTRSRTDAAGATVQSTSQFSTSSTTDLNLGTKSSEFDMSTTSDTGSRSAKTTTPITGPLNGAPTAGVIEINESDTATGVNRLIRVTMQSDGTALVEIDDNGDGVIDRTFTVPWFGGIGFGGGSPGFGGGGGGAFPPTRGGSPIASPPGGGGPISPVPPASGGGAPGPALGGGFIGRRP